ncbi:MAG: hypothetical protein AVDCRST_MAG77-4611, partial [uncultured Chloroflexi bacterium]
DAGRAQERRQGGCRPPERQAGDVDRDQPAGNEADERRTIRQGHRQADHRAGERALPAVRCAQDL